MHTWMWSDGGRLLGPEAKLLDFAILTPGLQILLPELKAVGICLSLSLNR